MKDLFSTVYVFNRQTHVLHKKVNGRSDERCNVDDIVAPETFNSLDAAEHVITEGMARACTRCFNRP